MKRSLIYLSFFSLSSLAFLSGACSQKQSPYDSGPLGLSDPILWKNRWDLSKPKQSATGVYLPDIQSKLQQPGQAGSRLAAGEAGGKQIAPPRLTLPGQGLSETFASAAGVTPAGTPLDARSPGQIRKAQGHP